MVLLPSPSTHKTIPMVGLETTSSVVEGAGFTLRAVAGIRILLAADPGTDPNNEGGLTVVKGRAGEGEAYSEGEATSVISLL